jgi:hypothetical protein
MRKAIALGLAALHRCCAKSAPTAGKVVSIEDACNEADGARVRLNGTVRYEGSRVALDGSATVTTGA